MINFHIQKNTQKKGFTLIEVMVTMVIFGIAVAMISGFNYDIQIQRRFAQRSLQSIDQGRKVIQFIADELRSANYGADGTYPIYEATATSIGFFSDLDGDGITEKIRYYTVPIIQPNQQSYDNLYKSVTTPSVKVNGGYNYKEINETITEDYIQYIKNGNVDLFQYHDSDYTGIEESLSPIILNRIRLVRIEMNIRPTADYVKDINVVTQITLRNLKEIQ